ncbi:hypothetical protein [Pseudonocardia sp. GCM10023141]|uniref:hypothetical protein n=1 Tax=Pseudonocardia sp. GCM10023141 TaxID=3252653 RepID=UPI00361CCD09
MQNATLTSGDHEKGTKKERIDRCLAASSAYIACLGSDTMTARHLRTVFLAMTAVIAASCTSSPPSNSAPTTPTSTAVATPSDAALSAYNAFWTVVDAAYAAPQSKSWDADLKRVGSGQALASVLADVANYASLPAHVQGRIQRSPRVQSASGDRVSISDCVDLGDSRVVSDTTGQGLNDLKNRVQRFRSRSDVVTDATGRWLVDRTAPALDEPC